MTIANELVKLDTQRKALADNLVVKSVVASQSETLSELVPKVLQISGNGSGGELDPELFVPNDFEYVGSAQAFTVPVSGLYRLEVWGAEGGEGRGSDGFISGGKGGYSVGDARLSENTLLYIYVGQKGANGNDVGSRVGVPSSFNGGGSGHTQNAGGYCSGAGGGGTDIRVGTTSLFSRVIVAGGGGGNSDGGNNNCVAGAGGGATGGAGTASSGTNSVGGTQTNGGITGYSSKFSQFVATYTTVASFGQGANLSNPSDKDNVYGAGGGGGWYGGGASIWRAAAGGSGYILTSDSHKPTGYLLGEEYYLANAIIYGGDLEFPTPFGAINIGHQGDGYARITLLSV